MKFLPVASCALALLISGCALLPRRQLQVESSRLAIVAPSNNAGREAVRELSEYLTKAFGHPIPELQARPRRNATYILQLELASDTDDLEGSYIGMEDGMSFRAIDGQSLHSVVCRFIMTECGGTWLWPGPTGTYCPRRSSLSVPQGKHSVPNAQTVTISAGMEGEKTSLMETKIWLQRLGCRLLPSHDPHTPLVALLPWFGNTRKVFQALDRRMGEPSSRPQFDPVWLWNDPYEAYALARLLGDRRVKLPGTRREFVSAFGKAAGEVSHYLDARCNANKQNPALLPQTMYQADVMGLGHLQNALDCEAAESTVSRKVQYLVALQEHRVLMDQSRSALEASHVTSPSLLRSLDAPRRLASMRRLLGTTFPLSLGALWHSESRQGDPAGQEYLRFFETSVPVSRLPMRWLWRSDPDNCGVTKKWWTTPKTRLFENDQWEEVSLDRSWDEQNRPKSEAHVQWAAHVMYTPTRLRARTLFVNFRAVGGQSALFLNGHQLVLEPAPGASILSGTFRALLSNALVEADEQTLFLRIERMPKQALPYGVCAPVWLSAEH